MGKHQQYIELSRVSSKPARPSLLANVYLPHLCRLGGGRIVLITDDIQGTSISKEDLFRFTNGHFLLDDSYELSRRYVRFDIEKLCDVVAGLSGPKKQAVLTIDKLENRSSKALLVTTEDASEYVVKIPCPNAGRPKYSTESEVAVLRFVRKFTTIPVPRVLAWSSDASNTVGVEYIVMEKVAGVQAREKWEKIDAAKLLPVIERLTRWERELTKIPFPAYGNLYYKNALTEKEMIPLDPSIDPEGEFCIGPSCDASWHLGPDHSALNVHSGPWMNLCEMGESLIERSRFRVGRHTTSLMPPSIKGSTEDHCSLLEMAKAVLPALANSPKLLENAQPTLWHTKLHISNIFVSESDPGEVTGFIDWQNISVGPAFLQAWWPLFLTPLPDYQMGTVMPRLMENFEDMYDEGEGRALLHGRAKNMWKMAMWAKAYEVATFQNNRSAWHAMLVKPELKEIFVLCATTLEASFHPLREALVDLFLNQRSLGLASENLPLHFTDEQITRHKKQHIFYREWYDLQHSVKDLLDTNDDGWILPERTLDEAKSANEDMFQYYLMKLPKSPEELRLM